MKWNEKFNEAMDYIEKHLHDEIDYDELGRITNSSSYHFQRMFAYIVSMPLSLYIRRRKMTLAAIDLQNGEKVIDVSFKYGYESPTAFNRAFKSIQGINPSSAKLNKVSFKTFPPLSFKFILQGDIEMNYRIEKRDAFRITGVSVPLSKIMEENFENIPKLWQKCTKDGTLNKLTSLINKEPLGVLGVSCCNNDDKYEYYIAVASDEKIDGLCEYIVPKQTWAIFEGEGKMPEAIQEIEKRIMGEWLPNSGYEYSNGPDMEVYLNDDVVNSKFEVWIPVVKK